MNLHLFISMHILFVMIQSFIYFNSKLLISQRKLKSDGLLGIGVDKVLSSAYNVYLSKLEQFGRSFIYISV